MPLLNLSLVTTSLVNLLDAYIRSPEIVSEIWDGVLPTNLLITGDPPDLLAAAEPSDGLSLYLYHIEEDKHRKNNQLPARGSRSDMSYQEMGLNLSYVLSAYGGNRGNSFAYEREQRLMGVAVKAFHDYPTLDANTHVGEPPVLVFPPGDLRSEPDEFRLVLRPASLEDLNKIWTSVTVPMRLSALYQVSIVLLEAERPTIHPVPVLTPQVDVSIFQSVWIQTLEYDLEFTHPEETVTHVITTPNVTVAEGESFRILGSGFGGPSAQVFLQSPFWSDPPHVEVTSWLTGTPTDTRLELEVTTTSIAGRDIVPGLYQIYVQNGSIQSNCSPLAIAPRLNPQNTLTPELSGLYPTSGSAGAAFTLLGGPFADDDTIRSVEVYFGDMALALVTTPPQVGEFMVNTGVSPARIDARVPTGLGEDFYPVRVAVNGISTPPVRWFQVIAP